MGALGIVAVVAAGIWVASYLPKKTYSFSIPKRLLKPNGNVDIGKFTGQVKGKTARKDPKTGWTIEKDVTGHGGKKWKLKDKSGKRKASLDGNGKILSK